MNKNILNIGLISVCSAICLQNNATAGFFDYVHPFIGVNFGGGNSFYDSDILSNSIASYYGTYINTTLSSDWGINFSYGANLGIRFVENYHVYHPGIQVYYDRIYDPVKLTMNIPIFSRYGGVQYATGTLTGTAIHTLTGCEFDNYFRIGNIGSIFTNYIVFGIDAGTVKSNYEITAYNYSISENNNFYGAKIEYLGEFKNGIGLTISTKLLKTNLEALQTLIITKLGLRYTF